MHGYQVWNSLSSRRVQGFICTRQCPFGNYSVDYVCIEKKLMNEVRSPHPPVGTFSRKGEGDSCEITISFEIEY
ncbi:DUF559 domain-containing protein [Legionella bononiensis]|uniref:DUF559 domain-containing protein n=1 Tax=Legionella bononiensis TaxID=2793102 RepID=UPI0034E21521